MKAHAGDKMAWLKINIEVECALSCNDSSDHDDDDNGTILKNA